MVATVRHLTRGEIAARAEDAASDLRDELAGMWLSGGQAAVRAAVDRRLTTDRLPLSVILLTDAHGRFVAGNIAEWPPNVPAPGAATIEIFRIGHSQPERMRVMATRLPDGSRMLAGHVVESELRVALAMEEAMAVGMAAAIVLAALAAWIAARMIERRLEDTVSTAHAVAAGDLSRRVAPKGGDDAFEALAQAVNAMLDRIALLMTELKVATDGLAHDLRSPLTRLRSTLDRALTVSHDENARVAVGRALEESDRLLAMLDTALRISRAEAGLGRDAFVEADLAAMVRDVADMFEPLAEDRGMTIRAEAPETLLACVHRELLGQAIANLIDNALKYGAGEIVVRVEPGPVLLVTDDGPGIAAERREEALKRFGRLDAARTESGAGLGLSLASAVAHLHGGTVSLEDNAPGLRVRLTLG
ncbi:MULTISPECIES: sensor histidine kinase [Sphingomonas]|jgi:signal transduction histidine kinase|uniref:histidine kinase n=1 Tax=Sphingomonas zeae TaxID=1646122 RepID=A0A7Y6EII1_9SPHN|nr:MULTISPECIES: HAMP domain-containing sensor histidine kinase [Sphingomonas]MBB4047446.1 signal transduction histidine kinase [Sphingomonas zeae]MDK8185194.1 HAMP domain-containing sensor histidine kinase [Sphingomonas zeae]MDK8214863.1 HAMP domain-containing sensor histidine kinase [Sphingomonas sp. UMB7805-LC452B]NUU48590.1 HAMP domain-containing histidine kinase [Sphingomonas zeae]